MIELTEQEQIAKHYSACLDSVNLINSDQPEGATDAEWTDCLARNKEHLRLMLAKNIFAGYDITEIEGASQ